MSDLGAIGEIFRSYGEFTEEHTLLSLGLQLGGLFGLGLLDQWMNTEPDVTYQSSMDFDADAMERRQQQEIKEVQDALKKQREQSKKNSKTMEASLQQTKKILDSFQEKPRLHLMGKQFEQDLEQLKQIYQQLQTASQTQESGQLQITGSLYQQASAMQVEYLEFEERWMQARSGWNHQWRQTHQLIQSSRLVQLSVPTTEGEEKVEVDCLFWSQGALEQAAQTLPPLSQPEDAPMETFTALCLQAENLSRQVQDLVREAEQKFLSAQVRIQLSASILEELDSRGWRMEKEADYAFEKDDERQTLHLALVNPVGDRVEFLFKPDDTLTMRPKFHGVNNRHVVQQLVQAIQSTLQNQGISIQDVSIS